MSLLSLGSLVLGIFWSGQSGVTGEENQENDTSLNTEVYPATFENYQAISFILLYQRLTIS